MIAGAGVTSGRSKSSTIPHITCNVTQPARLKSVRTPSRKLVRLPAATPQKLLQQQFRDHLATVARRQSRPAFRGPAPCASTAFQRPRIEDQCQVCSGTTQVPCKACKGAGRLTSSGYHKRNHVNANKVVGSSWTALERTLGWRHFNATHKLKAGKQVYVLMMATCDNSACIWVNLQNLKERERWASGWLQKSEIEGRNDLGAECQVCAGTGHMVCPLCKDNSVIIL